VQATLVGTEPAIKFDLYQKGVASLAADVFGDFKLDAAGAAGLAVPLLDEYELAFDVKKNVDAALASQESFAALADQYNLSSYQVTPRLASSRAVFIRRRPALFIALIYRLSFILDNQDKQAFLQEMKGVKAVMDAIERKVDRMVNNAPQMLFRTLSVRDFWLDMFGTTQVRALVAFWRFTQAPWEV